MKFDRNRVCFALALVFTFSATSVLASDCGKQPLSAGPIPADLIERCGDHAQGPLAIADLDNLAGSTAYGAELITNTFNSFAIAAPGDFVNIGPGAAAIDATCAFDDTDTLYCYDLAPVNGFYSYDVDTGAITTIGAATPIGAETVTGMAWDPDTSTMYASASVCGTQSSIYTVDLTSGATTLIGTNVDGSCIIDIFGRGGSDGDGDDEGWFAHDIVTDSIYSIDPLTGLTTLVGPTGFDANFAQGANCDDDTGICYLYAFDNVLFTARLFSVDTTTGAATDLGALADSLGPLTEVVADTLSRCEPIDLSITGSCPGPITITTTDGSGLGAILTGTGPGSQILPGGPCAGTPSGLTGLGLATTTSLDLGLTVDAPAGACGLSLQVLQVRGCCLSNVTAIP